MIIGLDVGGTHTDVVLFGTAGLLKEIKVPTNHSNLFDTVLTGFEKITENINPQDIQRVVLSTTLTTNAIVQDKIPDVGMIVSGGPGIDPENFRTHSNYYCVSGSIDHRGREIRPIDKDEIQSVAARLKAQGIRHVGVVGKFSVRNPIHETKINRIIRDDFEKVFLGHQISGNLNFPRRIATTFLNATVYPIHREFYLAVEKSLRKKGLQVPIHILKADGGTMCFEASLDAPGQTILSGPAASIMGAISFAAPKKETLVLDIGGTTTDMGILLDRVPVLEPLGIQIGRYKTLIRSLKTHSIGLGGDSAVRVVNGRLQIGPDRDGPAMAYGGAVPTPTDALVALNIFKGGDRVRALEGLQTISSKLHIGVEDLARQIFDQACFKILGEARRLVDEINSKPVYTVHELQEGYRVNPENILVLGGPAPYFAEQLKHMSGLGVDVVPKWEVANAIGAALARTTCEVTLFADTEQEIATAPEENFTEMVGKHFSRQDAVNKTFELLRNKALQMGACDEDLEMEVIENLQFNMVRGFYTTGRNLRIKAQVKPGLIHEYKEIAGGLYMNGSPPEQT